MLKCSIRKQRSRRKKLIQVWEWRLSEKPEYCELCTKKHNKKDAAPDCEFCEYREPELLEENKLFIIIANNCIFSRDINGRLDLNVFLKIADIYSEIFDLNAWDKLELIKKFRVVSGVEEKARKSKDIGNNTRSFGEKDNNRKVRVLNGKKAK